MQFSLLIVEMAKRLKRCGDGIEDDFNFMLMSRRQDGPEVALFIDTSAQDEALGILLVNVNINTYLN
jgi:hypothetical protein